MTDLLDMARINSFPQPFLVRRYGDKDFAWPLYDIDVETGILRLDVCGRLEIGHIGDVVEFKDADGVVHSSESFYLPEPQEPKP